MNRNRRKDKRMKKRTSILISNCGIGKWLYIGRSVIRVSLSCFLKLGKESVPCKRRAMNRNK